jgi:hypothetical protein
MNGTVRGMSNRGATAAGDEADARGVDVVSQRDAALRPFKRLNRDPAERYRARVSGLGHVPVAVLRRSSPVRRRRFAAEGYAFESQRGSPTLRSRFS